MNISNYLVLGKTSPLTYQVLGHLKTILILVLGFTVFEKPLDGRNCLGITIAMMGGSSYTEIKRRQQLKQASLPSKLEKYLWIILSFGCTGIVEKRAAYFYSALYLQFYAVTV